MQEYIYHVYVLSASLRSLDVYRSFSALFRVRYWGFVRWSFIPLTNRPILLCSAASYVLLLLCIMLKLHGYYYCCLLAFVLLLPACFLFFFHVSFLQPYAKDYALMYYSLCLSRSCLSPFRCPAVSACVCVSRSFGALFLRVPHRGCTGFYLPNRPNTTAAL